MNDGIKFLNDIKDSVKTSKIVTITALVLSALISIGSVMMAITFVDKQRHQVYVLENGSIFEAVRTVNDVQRDLECIDHVRHFHEIFYNLSPNQELIYNSINKALNYADKSVYDYSEDLKEQMYYMRLIQANAFQEIVVDSVKVDMNVYPYSAHTYATTYILRETNIAKYALETTCTLTETTRSSENNHGLTIGKFNVVRHDLIDSRNRNRR